MRGLGAFVLSVMVSLGATSAWATGKIRLAQTSVATNCMMTCNAQAATCQTTCLIPPAQLPSAVSNVAQQSAIANTACISACSTTQLTCQTNCARLSPSQ
jgi:hypothetical protein